MEQGWSVKQLHRLMLTSTAYRQASIRNPGSDRLDSGNAYYWHKAVQRLDAEIVRDRILAVSGNIDQRMHGPPVGIKTDTSGQIVVAGSNRRSVYVQSRRTQPVALLQVFDAPVMTVNCNKREGSTVASQSLMLMNSDFIVDYARAFADRVNRETSGTIDPAMLGGLAVEFDSTAYTLMRNPWSYGYGPVPPAGDQAIPIVKFTQYPHYDPKAKRWQGGEKFPDNPLRWSSVTATGGHPNDPQTCAIRRWTAPRSGILTLKGTVAHGSDKGDGIRLTLYSSRLGDKGSWDVHHRSTALDVTFAVEQGDTVDMIVSERGNHTSDSFRLTCTIELVARSTAAVATWTSEKDFRGPTKAQVIDVRAPLLEQAAYAWQLAYGRSPSHQEVKLSSDYLRAQLDLLVNQNHENPPQQAMTNFCQALISSNEFLYSD